MPWLVPPRAAAAAELRAHATCRLRCDRSSGTVTTCDLSRETRSRPNEPVAYFWSRPLLPGADGVKGSTSPHSSASAAATRAASVVPSGSKPPSSSDGSITSSRSCLGHAAAPSVRSATSPAAPSALSASLAAALVATRSATLPATFWATRPAILAETRSATRLAHCCACVALEAASENISPSAGRLCCPSSPSAHSCAIFSATRDATFSRT